MGEKDSAFVINPAGEVRTDTATLLSDAQKTSDTLWRSAYCAEGAQSPVCQPLPATLTRDGLQRDGYSVALPLLSLTTLEAHADAYAQMDGEPGISRKDLQMSLQQQSPDSPVSDMTRFILNHFEAIRNQTPTDPKPTDGPDSQNITQEDLKAAQTAYLDLMKETELLVEADFVRQHWDAFSTVLNGQVTGAGLEKLANGPYQPALKALQQWAGPDKPITVEDLDAIIQSGSQKYAAYGVTLDDLRRTFTPRY